MTEQLVIVGAGMVGHRMAEEVATDPNFEVHLIGEEEYRPYNRILLSEVLAGRADLNSLTLPEPHPSVQIRRGSSAVGIDRAEQKVLLADGGAVRYDKLVLATGARAFVPPITGLEENPKHVHVLRTWDDCRDVTARAVNAKHAVVVGGGLLGLEAACGLRRRGVPVTVLDLADRPMVTQLDEAAAGALTAALRSLDIDVRLGVSVAEVISAYGETVAVRLTDDSVLAADLLLLSCGIRARVGLAEAAGLQVDRGIVVGEDLATDDPNIFAVGDCAQPPSGMTGLLAPGWRQAEELAARLRGFPEIEEPQSGVTKSDPAPEIVKLKAAGIDLVTMGVRASNASEGQRVITLSDPSSGRHVELVLSDEELIGVTCVGMPELSPSLTVHFERRTPLPPDPFTLLAPEAKAEAVSPFHMPGGTTVCRCNTVTKNDIVHAWESGADSVQKVASATRATTGCGGCTEAVCGLVDWLNTSDSTSPVSA
ncbi:MAG: FAD-dependent oxidoreductase [Marmoricola sp.]